MLECKGRDRREVFGEGVRVTAGSWCLTRKREKWDALR